MARREMFPDRTLSNSAPRMTAKTLTIFGRGFFFSFHHHKQQTTTPIGGSHQKTVSFRTTGLEMWVFNSTFSN